MSKRAVIAVPGRGRGRGSGRSSSSGQRPLVLRLLPLRAGTSVTARPRPAASRTTLAAKQIDDRVRVIVTEVGPGSNVSRLDETQKLNTIGQTAEDIQRAAQNLSAQAQTIIDVSGSIDNTVSAILGNANEINATVKSINSTASALLPVVQTIHGDESMDARTGGVAAINKRAAAATSTRSTAH